MTNTALQKVAILSAFLVACLFSTADAAEGPADHSSELAGQQVTIGFITSLSGPAAPAGHELLNGLKLYLEQNHNKLGTHPVRLIVEDDASQPSVAASKLKKLVEVDGAQILDGFILSNIALVVAPMIDRMQIPTIFAVPNADDLTQRKRTQWAIRLSSSSSQSQLPFGEWVRKNLKYKRVAALGLNFALGWETTGGFQRTFEQAGGMVIQKTWVPLFAKDFSDQIKAIRPDADAVYFAVANLPAPIVVRQYQELGGKLPIIGAGQSFSEAIFQGAGQYCLGAVSALYYSPALQTPANQRFVESYRNKYSSDPSHLAEAGYVSAMWIDRALNSSKVDINDHAKVLSAFKAVKLNDAPRGPIRLDEYGNPIENIYILKVQNVDGKYQNSVIGTYKDVSQFWKWTQDEVLSEPSYAWNIPPCSHCD